jgi:hypothetical protein
LNPEGRTCEEDGRTAVNHRRLGRTDSEEDQHRRPADRHTQRPRSQEQGRKWCTQQDPIRSIPNLAFLAGPQAGKLRGRRRRETFAGRLWASARRGAPVRGCATL